MKKIFRPYTTGVTLMLLSVFFSFASGVESSLPSSNLKDPKLNVFEMKHKLEDQNRNLNSLSREMNEVEVNLGMQNKKYLKISETRVKLEEALNVAKKNIDLDNLNLKKNYNETKSVLMGIILNKLEKTEGPSDLLARKVLIQNLQMRMVDLEALMKSNKENQGSVDDLYQRLNDSVQNEKELISLMNELEEKKKNLKATIISETTKLDEAKTQFIELKNKVAMEKEEVRRIKKKAEVAPLQITEEVKIPSVNEMKAVNPLANYRAPLYSHLGIEHNQKGVTFKFQGKNEVLATRSGRIVYTGALANYGNVLMIDHGDDTRSVLLGQFDYTVKNGDAVSASQIVGHTNPRSTNGLGDGKIYFEVRKKNLAQNTYLLLDKQSLARR